MEFDVETDPEFMQELFGDDVGSLEEYVTFVPLLSVPRTPPPLLLSGPLHLTPVLPVLTRFLSHI